MNKRLMIIIWLLSPAIAVARQGEAAGYAEPHSTFAVLGAAVGTPSSIAVIAGLYADGWSVKLSGAPWGPNWRGIQGSVTVPFFHRRDFAHGVALVAGSFRVNPVLPSGVGEAGESVRSERYVGLAYDVLYAGFSLQAGLGAGSGDYKNPQLLIQCGYLITIP